MAPLWRHAFGSHGLPAFATVQQVLGNAKVLGNAQDAALIELSVGGLEVTCVGEPLDLGFAGGGFSWTRDGKVLASGHAAALASGVKD